MQKISKNQENLGTSNSISNKEVPIYPENVSIYKWKFSTLSDLPFGCRLIFVVSVILSLLSIFFKNYQEKLIFWGIKVVQDGQYQRLFLTYLLDGWSQMTPINLIAKLVWLRFLFCQQVSILTIQQRKLSTVHFLIDIFLQNLLINIVLSVFSIFYYDFLELLYFNYLVRSEGFPPLIMLFLSSQVARYANYRIDFFFLPFLVKVKYIPIFILLYRLTFGLDYFWADLFGFLIGYIQFMMCKKRFTRLPFVVHQKIEHFIPNFIKNSPNFIKTSDVEIDLKFQCWNGGDLQNLSRVGAVGGVQIDNTNEESRDKAQSFQVRWKSYGQNIEQNETKRDETEIEADLKASEEEFTNKKMNNLEPYDSSSGQIDQNFGSFVEPEEDFSKNGMIGGSQIGFYERWKSYNENLEAQSSQTQQVLPEKPIPSNEQEDSDFGAYAESEPKEVEPSGNSMIGGSQIGFYQKWKNYNETLDNQNQDTQVEQKAHASEEWFSWQQTKIPEIDNQIQKENKFSYPEEKDSDDDHKIQVQTSKPQKKPKPVKGVEIGRSKNQEKSEGNKQKWKKQGDRMQVKTKEQKQTERDDYLLEMNLKAFGDIDSEPQDEAQNKKLVN